MSSNARSRLDALAAPGWRFRDLIQVGETWRWATTPASEGGLGHDPETFGLPLEEASWEALSTLAREVLVPLSEGVGRPTLTYAFSGLPLSRLVARRVGRVAPRLDQHAACERDLRGALLCPRMGAAVDLRVPGVRSFEVGLWLARHTTFDRLYLYAQDRPLHVSCGPERAGAIVRVERGPGRRVVPRRLALSELKTLCEAEGEDDAERCAWPPGASAARSERAGDAAEGQASGVRDVRGRGG